MDSRSPQQRMLRPKPISTALTFTRRTEKRAGAGRGERSGLKRRMEDRARTQGSGRLPGERGQKVAAGEGGSQGERPRTERQGVPRGTRARARSPRAGWGRSTGRRPGTPACHSRTHRCAAWTRRASSPSFRACGRTPTGTGSTGGPPSPKRGSARRPDPGTAPGRCTPVPPASEGSAPRRAPLPCRCRTKPWGRGEGGRRSGRTRCRRPRGEQEPQPRQPAGEAGGALTNGGERLWQAAGSKRQPAPLPPFSLSSRPGVSGAAAPPRRPQLHAARPVSIRLCRALPPRSAPCPPPAGGWRAARPATGEALGLKFGERSAFSAGWRRGECVRTAGGPRSQGIPSSSSGVGLAV